VYELDNNRILMEFYWVKQKKKHFEGNLVDESEKNNIILNESWWLN